MEDIFDNLSVSFSFDDPEFAKKLVLHSLTLEAKVAVFEDLFIGLLTKTQNLTEEKANQYLSKLFQDKLRDVFLNSDLTVDEHRKGLLGELGLDPQ